MLVRGKRRVRHGASGGTGSRGLILGKVGSWTLAHFFSTLWQVGRIVIADSMCASLLETLEQRTTNEGPGRQLSCEGALCVSVGVPLL